MVFEPCLAVAPSDPAASQEIEAGNNYGDGTDDANGMSCFTEAACLPYT